MDSIELLEKRVGELESQVFGKNKGNNKLEDNQTIAGILLSTNAMVATALTRRETISTILQKLPQLNEYLDPLYSENNLEIESKRQYIIELYPQLKELAEQIQKFDQLKDVLDLPSIEKVTSLQGKLDQLVQINCEIYTESYKNSTEVLNVLKRYNEIIMSFKVLFMDLDKDLTIIENNANKKPIKD